MEISFNRVKNILDTLPIGVYANKRIECELSQTAITSYYMPMEDEIAIAYSNITASLSSLDEDSEYAETAIRSILYHEVSHALLTPKDVTVTDVFNIFEDERIETLLKYYYLNTDFKKNVIYLNGFAGEAPKNAMDEFYQTVRYRVGEPRLTKRVREIIDKYEYLNSSCDRGTWEDYSLPDDKSTYVSGYVNEIYNLYNEIAAKWGEKEKDYYSDRRQMENGEASGNGAGGLLNKETTDNNTMINPDDLKGDLVDVIMENADEQQAGMNVNSPDTLVGRLTAKYFDTDLTTNLERILDNFNKKNIGGSSVCAYSGIFNPRNVVRNDYKYFDHKMSINGSNTFGTFHLNLFLDDSGSMSSNEVIVNKLLYALIQVEKRNKNFTFDVYTCADRIEKTDKTKGYEARGGTYLRRKIVPLFQDAQKPNTFNYNLVLFDGSASTDKYLGGNTFKVFDTNNTTIITDPSNTRSLSKNTNCKIIVSSSYTKELIDNVYKVLQAAFR